MAVAVVEISLSQEEKNKLIQYAEDRKKEQELQLHLLETVELPILTKCLSSVVDAPVAWVTALNSKIHLWETSINNIHSKCKEYASFISMLTDGKAHDFTKYAYIIEYLYLTERSTTKLSSEYKYYPRLKRAKERTMYVFSNKLKTIMETRHGKII